LIIIRIFRPNVLYMHDGQFLLHHGQTPFLETDWLWVVDTTMARLI